MLQSVKEVVVWRWNWWALSFCLNAAMFLFLEQLCHAQTNWTSSTFQCHSGKIFVGQNLATHWRFGYFREFSILQDSVKSFWNFEKGGKTLNIFKTLKMFLRLAGKNEILGKNVISYSYNEEVIDSDGETVGYLRGPFNLIYDKKKLKTPPKIQSRFLGPNLFSTKAEDNTWKIQTINRK